MKNLTAQQLAHLRGKLSSSLARLEREIRSSAMGPVLQERDVWGRPLRGGGYALGSKQQEQAELSLISAAFARIDAGTYGTCTRCAAEVPYDVLIARPAAPTCEPCTEPSA
jgi:hypothetical protein